MKSQNCLSLKKTGGKDASAPIHLKIFDIKKPQSQRCKFSCKLTHPNSGNFSDRY